MLQPKACRLAIPQLGTMFRSRDHHRPVDQLAGQLIKNP